MFIDSDKNPCPISTIRFTFSEKRATIHKRGLGYPIRFTSERDNKQS